MLGHVLIGLVLSAQTTASEPLEHSGMGWRLTRVDLEIEPEPALRRFQVSGSVSLILEIEESFGPSLVVNSRGPIMEFLDFEQPEGGRLEWNLTVTGWPSVRMMNLRFDYPFEAGDELELFFVLQSDPDRIGDRSRAALQLLVREDYALASWVEGWYPFPLPRVDLGQGFSSRLLTAPGTKTFRLPSGWRAVTNGDRVSREESEDGVTEVWDSQWRWLTPW